MSKIKLLSDIVVNQIAAGEVVSRPVSVVKELVENSIDAESTYIEVRFKRGGKVLISIEDNGCGMGREDAMLCLERHATSKLEETKDLHELYSYGFRGEAIPSIASVSRFLLKTRLKDATQGTEILINGGKLVHCHETGLPAGTRIEVHHLFNSVPARRKFLKADSTEAAHIINLIKLYALAHPEVAFSLYEDDRKVFDSPAGLSFEKQIKRIWGAKLAKELQLVEAQEGSLQLSAMVSRATTLGRATRQSMYFLVNGRPVQSKTLAYAFLESYHLQIPKGRYPIVFAKLNISPELIDVNVHPAKSEIKFRNDSLVRQFVITHVMQLWQSAEQPQPSSVKTNEAPKPARPAISAHSVGERSLIPPAPVKRSFPEIKPAVLPPKPTVQKAVPQQPAAVAEPPQVSQKLPEAQSKWGKHPITEGWKFLAMLHGAYALYETPQGMLVVNCLGAFQRVEYEQLLDQFFSAPAPSQSLLIPVSLELESNEAEALLRHLNTFKKLGFHIEEFGRNFFRIEGIPGFVAEAGVDVVVRDLIEALMESDGGDVINRAMVERLAKKLLLQVKKPNPGWNEHNVGGLLKRLFNCNHPQTCPRGYSTYFEWSGEEMGKKFGK